jgi:hypothetical protein
MEDFWSEINIPEQNEFVGADVVNPADAFRKQALVVNLSGPIYAELELVDRQLRKVDAAEKELIRRILAQQIDTINGTKTRTTDLIDAFVLASAEFFVQDNETKDVRPYLIKWRRRISTLEARKAKLERRLKALLQMADAADRILNWDKHLAKLELAGVITR